MNINGVATNTDSSQLTGATSQALGKEDFLKLLSAQLQNQDPMQPMDNTQFVAQLAQFSSLEQLMSLNTGITDLTTTMTSANTGQLASLIGKQVEVDSSKLTHQQASSEVIPFELGSAADSVTLQIYDSTGSPVRTLKLGAQGVGAQEATWDGRNSQGQYAAAGTYKVTATATASGADVPVNQKVSRTVDGVVVQDGRAYLEAGSQKLSLSDVSAIR